MFPESNQTSIRSNWKSYYWFKINNELFRWAFMKWLLLMHIELSNEKDLNDQVKNLFFILLLSFFSLILSLLGFMMRFFPKHRRLKTASKTFFLFYELVNHTSLLLRQPSALSSKRNKPMVNWKQFSSFQRTPPSSGDGRYL